MRAEGGCSEVISGASHSGENDRQISGRGWRAQAISLAPPVAGRTSRSQHNFVIRNGKKSVRASNLSSVGGRQALLLCGERTHFMPGQG